MATFLIADIGGTNARFKLLSILNGEANEITSAKLRTNRFLTLPDCVNFFLGDTERPLNAVIGIAGAICDNTLTVTSTK